MIVFLLKIHRDRKTSDPVFLTNFDLKSDGLDQPKEHTGAMTPHGLGGSSGMVAHMRGVTGYIEGWGDGGMGLTGDGTQIL